MMKSLLAAMMVTALITAPLAPAHAQAAAEKSTKTDKSAKPDKTAKTEKAAPKKLTPQQQKMKDCAGKWKDEKTTKKVSGRAAYNKFMSVCLKG